MGDLEQAAVKIQALQRGRQTRAILSRQDLDGARAVFQQRHMMRELHMDGESLEAPLQRSLTVD